MGPAVGVAAMKRDRPANEFAEELFRLAVEACPNGMLMTDSSGTIVLVNGETERLFGYDRSELIGRSIEVSRTGADAQAPLGTPHALCRASNGPPCRGKPRPVWVAARTAANFRSRSASIRSAPGNGLLVLCVIVDISAAQAHGAPQGRIRLDRQPRTAHAADLDRRLARLLLGGAGRHAARHRPAGCSAIAHNNSQRLVRLVNDILDIEKIESGSVVFNFSRIDAAVARRAGDRGQSRLCRRLRRAGSARSRLR